MSMTCFPYGFPTSYALSPRGSSRIWPRCTNAEPGSYGHECGEPADFIGSRADGGQSCFCSACKAHGSEARCYSHWHALQAAMGQRERGCRGNGCARLHRDASGRSWLRLDRPHLGQHGRTGHPTGLGLAGYSGAFCACCQTRRMIRTSASENQGQVQLIARSPGALPTSRAATNHSGLRPRPDQVRLGFSGWRYFAAAGARVGFTSVPIRSAKE